MSTAAAGRSDGRGLPERVPETPDEAQLKAVFREYASGVTVVSTRHDGIAHAMTASAFCSVSLDPPMVLVCVARSARFHAAVLGSGRWAASILTADQQQLAAHFARPGRDLIGQFADVDHVVGRWTEAPVLTGAAAWLECETRDAHPAGDHTVLVADVLAAGVNAVSVPPLTYHRGGYASPGPG
ncbi:flavin reductase family protein [Propionibacteriaceae bacterium Y2011]|uniref:flavin reductase family protein n=1 Tax=Microlunatus sp. Y2014 TaxID=3418488 RepID=UPI003B499773